MIYIELFWSFFKIALFSFGGGYAAVPLIQSQIVEQNGWMELAEFTDFITISEMTPGPIVINCATFVGQKLAGIPGAIVCTLGSVAPSLIIGLILSWFYMKFRDLSFMKQLMTGLRPAIVAMIASAGLSIFVLAIDPPDVKYIELVLCAAGLVLLRRFKVNPVLIIFGSGLVGLLAYVLIPGAM